MIGSEGSGNNGGMIEAGLTRETSLSGTDDARPAGQARAHALVNQHFDFIWRLLRCLGVPESDVDDAAQRTFIIATQRLSDIKIGNERTFLYGTALRIAGTLSRDRRRRQRIIDPEPADGVSAEPMPDEQLERRRALALLDQVLQHLDDSLREVFVLCEIEELTAPEVAAIIGSAVGTVASRLRRARKKFDVQLKRLQVKPARRR